MTTAINPLGLTSLEIASNVILGEGDPARRLPPPVAGMAPRVALERAVLPALSRGPCGISFSGGRDSSAALATAAAVARREGLDPPIPMTLRFVGVDDADEASWQEDVIRHTGLEDWERIDVTDELDMLGPYARALLRRHGLLWPANTYFHAPMLERLRGGSLVTGVDGDGVFAGWRWQQQADLLARRRRGRPRDALRVLHALSPPPVRRVVSRLRASPPLEWLQPAASRALAAAAEAEWAREPFRWSRRVRWYDSRRHLHLLDRSYDAAAAPYSVVVKHFFRDPRFLSQLARRSFLGPGDRTTVMRELFGDLLPEHVLARPTKATFGTPFWGPVTRDFIETWDGSGADEGVVDTGALRRVWRDGRDPGRQSALLLQSLWLSTTGDRR